MVISLDETAANRYAFTPQNEKRVKQYRKTRLPRDFAALEEEERMKRPLNLFFNQNNKTRKLGLTGLRNLGNTCFLNSMLQCLANTEPMVKYFLYELHLSQINPNSSYGTRGKLALAFGDLIYALYVGEHKFVIPIDLKRQLERKDPQYEGDNQHDSQEVLSMLLTTIHEDIN